MPETASGLTYGIGFLAASGLLHLAGIGLGLAAGRVAQGRALPFAGAAVAVAGVAVALAVGFRNEKSFSRAFSQWTGLAPGAWRQAAAEGTLPPAPGASS